MTLSLTQNSIGQLNNLEILLPFINLYCKIVQILLLNYLCN